MKHVVILGAGFAGLELTTCLSASLAGEVHTTLIDQNDGFTFGFSKLDVLFGRKAKTDVVLGGGTSARPCPSSILTLCRGYLRA